MEKKFEKKTKFGCLNGSLKSMATVGSRHYYNNGIGELAQHVIDCHAEIDRLEDEPAALRAQVPSFEKVTGKVFPVKGVYFVTHKETGLHEAYIATAGAEVSEFFEYTLILAEADFPVPPKPKPLEVKVGKYEFQDNGHFVTLDVLAIRTYSNGLERVIYCYPDDLRSSKDLFDCGVEELQKRLADNNARFIGGGDDAE